MTEHSLEFRFVGSAVLWPTDKFSSGIFQHSKNRRENIWQSCDRLSFRNLKRFTEHKMFEDILRMLYSPWQYLRTWGISTYLDHKIRDNRDCRTIASQSGSSLISIGRECSVSCIGPLLFELGSPSSWKWEGRQVPLFPVSSWRKHWPKRRTIENVVAQKRERKRESSQYRGV